MMALPIRTKNFLQPATNATKTTVYLGDKAHSLPDECCGKNGSHANSLEKFNPAKWISSHRNKNQGNPRQSYNR
eukprot:m.132378 g.132378  ORF g.132378 m.132378 type:complete len:74 (-) comp13793_c0_seq5:382-603(-)